MVNEVKVTDVKNRNSVFSVWTSLCSSGRTLCVTYRPGFNFLHDSKLGVYRCFKKPQQVVFTLLLINTAVRYCIKSKFGCKVMFFHRVSCVSCLYFRERHSHCCECDIVYTYLFNT